MSLRGICLDRVQGGYRVKQTQNHNVFVVATVYDWRILATSRHNPHEKRQFGYRGTGLDSFTKAVLAAWEWDAEYYTEPGDWDFNFQTRQRRVTPDAT